MGCTAAVGVRRHHGVRRRARGADVVRARVPIVGDVGVVVHDRDGAVGRALAALAIAGRLNRQHLAGGLADGAARTDGAGPVFTLRFDARAVRRDVARGAGLVGPARELAVGVHDAGVARRALSAVAAAVDAGLVAVLDAVAASRPRA